MSGHTSGPWTVSRGAQADPFAIEAASRTIAHVRPNITVAETRANANLLAAAPTLLAELRAVEWGGMTDRVHGGYEPCCPSCGAPESGGAHVMGCGLRDAITRAEGNGDPE